ncbi:MAG: hypothetical protein ABI823_10320 [Bryobacteraceae bacterium]
MGFRFVCCFALPFIGVAQSNRPADPVRAAETAQMSFDANNKATADELKARFAKYEHERFTERFNHLIDAMQAFTEEYNKAPGAVWPQKKAEAIEQAFRDLQKTESWRRAAAAGQLASRTAQAVVPEPTSETVAPPSGRQP